ncbi:hypothetical protein [Peribacillus sp. SCS-155]|uniref:hypothetical protein n=1 Tax=Peribacillus sedimenti TaxID=3115297 RepID=UPI0039059E30
MNNVAKWTGIGIAVLIGVTMISLGFLAWISILTGEGFSADVWRPLLITSIGGAVAGCIVLWGIRKVVAENGYLSRQNHQERPNVRIAERLLSCLEDHPYRMRLKTEVNMPVSKELRCFFVEDGLYVVPLAGYKRTVEEFLTALRKEMLGADEGMYLAFDKMKERIEEIHRIYQEQTELERLREQASIFMKAHGNLKTYKSYAISFKPHKLQSIMVSLALEEHQMLLTLDTVISDFEKNMEYVRTGLMKKSA